MEKYEKIIPLIISLSPSCLEYRYIVLCISGGTDQYMCTFENGLLCGLRQMVGDSNDWWLVNASFVRKEIANSDFVDHTFGNERGIHDVIHIFDFVCYPY